VVDPESASPVAGRANRSSGDNAFIHNDFKNQEIHPMNVLEILGSVIEGKYRIESPIGSGGFGTVFRARHLGLGHPVAVKLLTQTAGPPSDEELAKFRQEAASAFRLKHPNAVTVYDFGITSDGLAYLVMELLEGKPLSKELQTAGKMSPRRCGEILVPVCEVLAEAHAEGIIHRDIKPENIFLNATKLGEQVKVVDFGIAKLTDHTLSFGKEVTTALVGTPAFMSPERLQNQPYDGRADVYSVGVTLFQMLAGRVPFKATDPNNIAAILLMHVNTPPPNFQELGVEVPPEMEALVRLALEKNPAQRPGAAEFGERLREITGVGISGFNRTVTGTPVATSRPTPGGVPALTQPQSTTGTNPFFSSTSAIGSIQPDRPTPTDQPTLKERTDETKAFETRSMSNEQSPVPAKSSSGRLAAVAATTLGGFVLVSGGLWAGKTFFAEKPPAPPVSAPASVAPPPAAETKKAPPPENGETPRKSENVARNRAKLVKSEKPNPAKEKDSGAKPPPGVPADLWHGKKPNQ
jgi:serine/threonine protein kinase